MFFLVFWLKKRVGPMWPTLWELGLKVGTIMYFFDQKKHFQS
jgi:hypothetical protein